MAEVKKITKSSFKSEWAGPNGIIYYHEIFLEGDDKAWQIGAQAKEPDFLNAGQTLTYEIKDAAKRSLKRVKLLPPVGGNGGGGGYDGVGAMVGNAITNAVTLIAHGKADIKDLEKVAHRICEVSMELKKQFTEQK